MSSSTIPNEKIFQLESLTVRYGRHIAVDSLSLSAAKGESLGLLGVNGAGKTSTLRVLMGMLKPQGGTATVFGQVPGSVAVLSRLGFAPEEATPPEKVTGREYLRFVAALRKSKNIAAECDSLLEVFDLAPHKRVSDYSKGMRRRLVLAQAFIGTPEFLILDEPLNGLDPLIITKLRQRLENYRLEGGTLLYSSHILAEVERTCTRVAILHRGKLAREGSVPELVKQHGSIEAAFESAVGAL